MASRSVQGARFLGAFRVKGRFEKGLGLELPDAYKKFWREWKVMQPAAVHYVPEAGRWKKDEVTGEINPIQNAPIPLKFPAEADLGIWGGEAVIKGFQKRHPKKRRVPHFWVPTFRRSVVRSEVLNVHLSVVVTNRTLTLIHDNYGFDHYLLKTPACDLKSELALKLKQKILQNLQDGCPAHADNPKKQEEIYSEYKEYLSAYTAEDIEWYGLTWAQAIRKMNAKIQDKNKPTPLKHQYRSQLIDQLKAAGIAEAQDPPAEQIESSWMSKINLFGKKHET